MRTKDIHVGGRYVARHRGATVIVTIDEIVGPREIGRTSRVVATNQATGERIEFASPMSIFRPAGPYIGEVGEVADLYADQIAVPEPGVVYRLREIAVATLDCGTVDYVIRRGGALFAKTSSGKELPVTGEGASILVPSRS